MPFPFRSRAAATLALAALIAVPAATLPAQTLHHRPKAEPQPPAAAAVATPTAQQPAGTPTLPAGTSLQVETTRRYGMKKGETIEARLMYPIYADNRLVVPAGTMLRGQVVGLKPNHKERVAARLNGDFTPFRTAEVRFSALELPGGAVAIEAAAAANGAPVLYLKTPGTRKHVSLIRREWAAAKQRVRDQIDYFTPPGLRMRLLTLLYRQLPYHPQWIAEHTAWNFELKTPAELPEDAAAEAQAAQVIPAAAQTKVASGPELWHVHAILEDGLNSATAKAGDAVKALVVEPVFDNDEHIAVPQGSVLVGKVTKAKAARSFERNGSLRFSFQQLQLPKGYRRQVQGELAGAATDMTQNLKLDAEGTVTPRSQRSAIVPLLLTVLAVKGLDQDGNLMAHTTAASNGFGLVGRVVGMAAGSRNLAAGIGMYAAALSFSNNFLRHGRNVVFPRDTRVEIETTPMRAPVLKPEGQ
ncbi:MAG TPA: hypothetical protein VND90_06780 [Terracidiphilus sp.]|nr:hypothetical protein [Terracidiphilus sp.]